MPARDVHGNRLPATKAAHFYPCGVSQFELSAVPDQPSAEQMNAYERVLGDAMAGDATLFAREDYVEEAWRIVDPLLQKATPVYSYEPNGWGPNEIERVTPPGGWQNPMVAHEKSAVAGQAA